MPTITGYINTWVNPYEKEKCFQILRRKGVLILALSVNQIHIILQELPKDETKGQKCIPTFPVEKMNKKEKKLQNNGNIFLHI